MTRPHTKSALHRPSFNLTERLEHRTLLDGLTGQYFNRLDFTEPVLTRVDSTVDYTWSGAPAAGVRQDFFSVRWTGQVLAPTTDVYTFHTNADDGVRLWVDGRLLIDNWQNQGPTDRSGSIVLDAGKRYDIRLDYYEYDLGARVGLSWSSSTFTRTTIPSAALFSQGAGLTATFFNDANFIDEVATRTDDGVFFTWPDAPAAEVTSDGFSARWSGQVAPAFSEMYRFYATRSDSGATVRLRVDGQLIIDSADATKDGRIRLEAGKRYDLLLEYSDPAADAGIRLEWSSPSVAKQVIPGSALFAAKPTSVPTTRLTYTNPIIDLDRPDPGILFADGAYWMTHTTGGPGYGWPLWKSTNGVNWSYEKDLLTPNNKRSWMNGNYWAPELHKVGGNFILTGTSIDSRTGRMTIAMASSPTINGTYTVRSEPIVSDSRHVLDSHIFIDDDGTPYLLWKRDGPSDGTFGSIRIRKLDSTGLNFAAGSTETVILDNNVGGWERNLAEAPWLVRRADAYYLFYSGAFIDTSYSVGVARSTSLTQMFTRNSANPILANNSTWGGPGHGAFALDRDGTLYHQYHARLLANPDAGRKQLLDPVIWNANGWPSFGNGGTPSPVNAGPRVAAPTASTALTFSGDIGGFATADTFRLVRSAANSGQLEIHLNGSLARTIPFAQVLSITFDGKSGNDTLELDASNGEVIPGAGVTFTGGAGTADKIRWVGPLTGDTLRLFPSGKLAHGTGLLNVSGIERLETADGDVRLMRDLNSFAPGLFSLSVQNSKVSIDAIQQLVSLSLIEGATVTLNTSALMVMGFAIDSTSMLDLGTGALVIDCAAGSSPVAAIEASVRGAKGEDETWTHPGITSSLASGDPLRRTIVGVAEATDVFGNFPATFAGQTVDDNSVLVRATLAGDLDLDRSVTFNDLLTLAQHFGQTGRRYAEGNVDYSTDGSVVFDDLLRLAQGYGQALLSPALGISEPFVQRKAGRRVTESRSASVSALDS